MASGPLLNDSIVVVGGPPLSLGNQYCLTQSATITDVVLPMKLKWSINFLLKYSMPFSINNHILFVFPINCYMHTVALCTQAYKTLQILNNFTCTHIIQPIARSLPSPSIYIPLVASSILLITWFPTCLCAIRKFSSLTFNSWDPSATRQVQLLSN